MPSSHRARLLATSVSHMARDPHWPTASDWFARADENPEIVLIGVPTSAASISKSDAWETPTVLRELLQKFSTFDSETAVDLERIPVADWGDWLVAHMPPPEAQEFIEHSAAALPTRPTYMFLGGDNSITAPLVSGMSQAPLERTGLITFDAHHDVRVMTDSGPTNGTPVRQLLEGGLDGSHVVQIGIHSFANSLEYRAYVEEAGVRVATMRMVDQYGIRRVVDEALAYLEQEVDIIYVDFDLDVLDRSTAPGCPGSRPGGMTPRQLANAARRCGANPKVVAADFVEVDAGADVGNITMMNLATTMLSFAAGVGLRLGEGVPEDQA